MGSDLKGLICVYAYMFPCTVLTFCMDVLYVYYLQIYVCIFVYMYICMCVYLFYVYVYLYVCIPGIHPSNFVVRLTAQKLNLITFDFKAFWH